MNRNSNNRLSKPNTKNYDIRSPILSVFFEFLNDQGATFCVMNNYEDLPEFISSDIDIAIDRVHFSMLDNIIFCFTRRQGIRVLQKIWHGNLKCAYILEIVDEQTSAFLQLDFFVDFSVKGCPLLIKNVDLVAGRRRLRNFFTPRPEVEIPFLIIRRIFKNDWNTGHCTRISEICKNLGSSYCLYKRFDWMNEIISLVHLYDISNLIVRRPSFWMKLRLSAFLYLGLFNIFSYFFWQWLRILHRLRYETGVLVLIRNSRHAPNILENTIAKSLKQVFHRSLIIEQSEATYVSSIRSFWGLLRLLFKIKVLKIRKGLVLVRFSNEQNRESLFERALYSLRLVDVIHDHAHTSGVCFSEIGILNEMILESQTRKTLASTCSKLTQTSGGGFGR